MRMLESAISSSAGRFPRSVEVPSRDRHCRRRSRPVLSRLETIDSFGLNDAFIATHFHGDRSDYVLSENPTLVVLISRNRDTLNLACRMKMRFSSLASRMATAGGPHSAFATRIIFGRCGAPIHRTRPCSTICC